MSWKGTRAATELGQLRFEMANAGRHQRRVASEWDQTLELVQGIDFGAIAPGSEVERVRSSLEVWHELTLEPVRRIASGGEHEGLPGDRDERFDYLHRVFVGMEPDRYLAMCDELETELEAIEAGGSAVAMPDARDRLVELMELGVHATARYIEWLDGRIRRLEGQG